MILRGLRALRGSILFSVFVLDKSDYAIEFVVFSKGQFDPGK